MIDIVNVVMVVKEYTAFNIAILFYRANRSSEPIIRLKFQSKTQSLIFMISSAIGVTRGNVKIMHFGEGTEFRSRSSLCARLVYLTTRARN